ncbi:hypothetical protein ABK040_015745 [Willaertia magna]
MLITDIQDSTLKSQYSIKSYLYNGENKIEDCNIIDNEGENGTYFIEFNCPSEMESFKLKTFIEVESQELNIINLNNTEIIDIPYNNVLIENQVTKLTLQLKTNNYFGNYNNLKIDSFITDLNNNKISPCILQNNNNNGTFTVVFKTPSVNYNEILLHCLIDDKPVKNSLLKFTIIKPEIINNLKTNVLIENQFTKLKLQLKTNDELKCILIWVNY